MKNDAKKVNAILIDPHAEPYDKQLAGCEADVLAFAYTFGKGINPEAVEDMRNALEGLLREISYGNGNVFSEITAKLNHKTTRQLQRLCKEAKSALEKSKL